MLITFRDNDRSQKPDQTGHNKIGYITRSLEVIFPWRSRVIRQSLPKIERLPHKKIPLPDGLDANCAERFFVDNFQTIDLFNQGLISIHLGEFGYFSNPIKLPRLDPIDLSERNFRWNELKLLVRKGDALFTFDTKSLFSKLITMVDNGPWSHAAMCTGEETLLEAITSGVQERSLDVYADPRYRVGLYRPLGLTEPEKSLDFLRSQIGKPYGYSKAALVGVQKFLRIRRFAPTPNDLAVAPNLQLICYA